MNLIEDIHHFLMECTAITDTRKNILGLQRPYLDDEDSTIAEFLLFGHKTEETIYRNRDDLQKLSQLDLEGTLLFHKVLGKCVTYREVYTRCKSTATCAGKTWSEI